LLKDVDRNLEQTSKELFDNCLKAVDLLILMLFLQSELSGFELQTPVWDSRWRTLFDLLLVPEACALASRPTDSHVIFAVRVTWI